jgi:hypothetical protein
VDPWKYFDADGKEKAATLVRSYDDFQSLGFTVTSASFMLLTNVVCDPEIHSRCGNNSLLLMEGIFNTG